MDSLGVGWENRATLSGIITDRDDVIEVLACKLIDRLGAVARNVNTKLQHDRDCFGPQVGRIRASAENLKTVSSVVPKQAFRHLAARGVSRTKNKDALLMIHGSTVLPSGIAFGLAWGTKMAEASWGSDGTSHQKSNVAAAAPAS